MKLLTNHIGYECLGPKQAILQSETKIESSQVTLVSASSGEVIKHIPILTSNIVDQWHQGSFSVIDFSDFQTPGSYYLSFSDTHSHIFEIADGILMERCFSDLLHYFKSQRCSGVFNKADHSAPVLGTSLRVDVSGGWYDASGDLSKYLSHLSYANYLNPQQIPMVVWNMLKGLTLTQGKPGFANFSALRLQEEALFGADFLVRMLSTDGYFYTTVFDKWSKDVQQRDICAYETQLGHKTESYQAAFRQGAGIAIAALASASRLQSGGEFELSTYLQSAETAYWHLVDNNQRYCNDGEQNIIDEYCALIGAIELFKSTNDDRYLQQSRSWAQALCARQQSDLQQKHFWSANSDGSRPYFHAAEAGLPVIALVEYLAIETNRELIEQITSVIENALKFELTITGEVNNPFGYPRQYVKGVNEAKRSAFFVAHDNESGYWWQGENARLGSLAAMVYLAKPYIKNKLLKAQLTTFAQNALNWIVGLNPYDMCMLDGVGFNNPDYLPELGFFNAKGGVCNGITAGFDNENDIAFNPPGQADDPLQNWRWAEQWIPHGAWYLLAICTQFSDQSCDADNESVE